jgi:hypothetical protein
MKRITNGLLFTFLVTLLTITAFSQALQCHYDFNESSLKRIKDQSKTNITGTGYALRKTEGIDLDKKSAVSFNGTISKINCGEDDREIVDKFTISLWFKTENTGRQILLSKYSWRQDNGYFIAIIDGAVTIGGRVGNGTFYELRNNKFICDNKWHHVTGVYNKGHWQLYVDCELIKEEFSPPIFSPFSNKNIPLTIGYTYEATGDGDNRFYDGQIDEVKIYNKALNQEEINSLCSEQVNCTSNVTISPNPVTNLLKVDFGDQMDSLYGYTIYDISGQIVKVGEIPDYYIDVTSLSSGIYLIAIRENINCPLLTKKMVKIN